MGSPFTVQVQPGPTSAVHSLITGTGLQYAEAGVEGVFFVTLRDAQLNERRTSIGEPVTLDDARMSCADQGLGVYRCSYLITQAQTLNVILRVNGQPVNPVAPHSFAQLAKSGFRSAKSMVLGSCHHVLLPLFRRLVINPKPIDSTSGVRASACHIMRQVFTLGTALGIRSRMSMPSRLSSQRFGRARITR